MESLTPEEFDELVAYHQVIPMDHTERMLGFIAWMLSEYLNLTDDEDEKKDVRRTCMPWIAVNDKTKYTVPKSNPLENKIPGSL